MYVVNNGYLYHDTDRRRVELGHGGQRWEGAWPINEGDTIRMLLNLDDVCISSGGTTHSCI